MVMGSIPIGGFLRLRVVPTPTPHARVGAAGTAVMRTWAIATCPLPSTPRHLTTTHITQHPQTTTPNTMATHTATQMIAWLQQPNVYLEPAWRQAHRMSTPGVETGISRHNMTSEPLDDEHAYNVSNVCVRQHAQLDVQHIQRHTLPPGWASTCDPRVLGRACSRVP